MLDKKTQEVFSTRVLTSFGVSIGTGLMLETLADPTTDRYDPDREIPDRVDTKRYEGHIYNVYTLIRNIISSLSTNIDITDDVLDRIVLELKYEIEVLSNLYSNITNRDDYLHIFIPEYDKLYKMFNKGKDVKEKYILTTLEANKNFSKRLEDLNGVSIIKPQGYRVPKSYTGNYLVTTHFTIDLLQSNYWTLLESHTGVLKDNHLWYTKYKKVGKEDLSHIPMVDVILYILGDNQLVKGLDIRSKKELISLGIDNNWTYRTTRAKVVNDFKKSTLLKDLAHVVTYGI